MTARLLRKSLRNASQRQCSMAVSPSGYQPQGQVGGIWREHHHVDVAVAEPRRRQVHAGRDRVHQSDGDVDGVRGESDGGADADALPHRVVGAAPRPQALGLQAGARAGMPTVRVAPDLIRRGR